MAPGPTQILIIALIILLLFGATRLSEIGKGLGEGIRNFKKGIQDEPDEEGEVGEGDKAASKNLPPRKKKAEEAEQEPTDQERAS